MKLQILSAMTLSAVLCVAGSAAEPIDIGSRLELFIDDYLVESLDGGARFDIKSFTPREVVLVHDDRGQTENGELTYSWEGNTCYYHSLIQEDGHFKMYYRGSNWTKERAYQTHEVACMVTSKDGIHWERPTFGLYKFEFNRGRTEAGMEREADIEDPKANNIVWPGSLEAASWISFKDPNLLNPQELKIPRRRHSDWLLDC